jgi:hypothetical protein
MTMADPELADGAAEETSANIAQQDEGQQTQEPAAEGTENTQTEDTGQQTEENLDQGEEGQQTSPDDYKDFELPEGMELDEDLLKEATPLFSELGLTKEQAQKFVDLQAKQVQSQVEAHTKQVNEWTEAVKNDKELGGEDFDKNIGIAKLGIEKVGSPELKELMDNYGIGSHPEMVRAFYKIGKLVQEDNPESGARVSNTQKSVVERLYGKGE